MNSRGAYLSRQSDQTHSDALRRTQWQSDAITHLRDAVGIVRQDDRDRLQPHPRVHVRYPEAMQVDEQHLMTEAIRGHQRSSEAIRGHSSRRAAPCASTLMSEAIRGNQTSSEQHHVLRRRGTAIRRNQTQSDAIRGNQTQSPCASTTRGGTTEVAKSLRRPTRRPSRRPTRRPTRPRQPAGTTGTAHSRRRRLRLCRRPRPRRPCLQRPCSRAPCLTKPTKLTKLSCSSAPCSRSSGGDRGTTWPARGVASPDE